MILAHKFIGMTYFNVQLVTCILPVIREILARMWVGRALHCQLSLSCALYAGSVMPMPSTFQSHHISPHSKHMLELWVVILEES